MLDDYQKLGGRNPDSAQATGLAAGGAGRAEATPPPRSSGQLHLSGQDEELHRRLGDLWLDAEELRRAPSANFGAVVALKPLDQAGAHFNLARAYFAARQLDKAEDQVLAALEAAPGYRPAQKLLLELEDVRSSNEMDKIGHRWPSICCNLISTPRN